MQFIFATNNQHKIQEIQAICPAHIRIIGLQEAGIQVEVEEPYDTFEENAFAKCREIVELTGQPCFSEDSGLVVEALNGRPGVKSARYAREHGNHQSNYEKILEEMKGIENRSAYFTTVICMYIHNNYHYYSGQCHGKIADKPAGTAGFGYDPIFIPNGYQNTFAELSNELKVNISHRKKAFEKLVLSLSFNK